jgi:N-methylhydantoinase B/oxoprolinase/acetone carboxylase alpha subunit
MAQTFDPILSEVMRHELIPAFEEMNITMKQTTRSIVAKEAGDYSAGLLDPEGRVIAQAIPYGLGYFTAVMPHIIAKYRGKFRLGDVIISNDPYGGLSHLPDIALVLPIFWGGDTAVSPGGTAPHRYRGPFSGWDGTGVYASL